MTKPPTYDEHRRPARIPPPNSGSEQLAAPAQLLRLGSLLNRRDLDIADWLYHHDVFTTRQLAQAFYPSVRAAHRRLTQLARLDWISRFTLAKPTGGLAIYWTLGPHGARWCAAERHERPPTEHALRRRRAQLSASPQLRHRLGVHQFFADLYNHARDTGADVTWWSARETAREFGQRIHPDAAGQLSDAWFFLEHDTGTESLRQLLAKLDAYAKARDRGGPDWPVLFHLPTVRREIGLHHAFRGAAVAVTVATAVHGNHPAARVWRPVGAGPSRHRLLQLRR